MSWLVVPEQTGARIMAAMNCEEFRKEWKEESEKENFNPGQDAFTHLAHCRDCCKWCDDLFAETISAFTNSGKPFDFVSKLPKDQRDVILAQVVAFAKLLLLRKAK